MTKVNYFTDTRQDALEGLYTAAVRLMSLRSNPYTNRWTIERAIEELEIFTSEIQRHESQERGKS